MSEEENLSEEEKSNLLKEMEIWIDLYKFYFDLTLKANAIFYGIAGAVASFVLDKNPVLLFALLFPAILGFILAIVSLYGSAQFNPLQERFLEIMDKISPNIHPLVKPLQVTLCLAGILSLIVSLVLFCLPFVVHFHLIKLG